MPKECLHIGPNGSKMTLIPTEEEIKAKNDENYKDVIYKHKIYGTKVRTSGWATMFVDDCHLENKVYFQKPQSFVESMDMLEFSFMYEKVGKAKYTTQQLDTMKFELEQ